MNLAIQGNIGKESVALKERTFAVKLVNLKRIETVKYCTYRVFDSLITHLIATLSLHLSTSLNTCRVTFLSISGTSFNLDSTT